MSKSIIIAEVGVNHNGAFNNAIEYIKFCSEIGVDYVKFQTFRAEDVVTKNTLLVDYQNQEFQNYDNQLELLKSFEFDANQFVKLKEYCDNLGIGFLTSAFDIESARFVNSLGLDYCKIASGEITNFPLIDILCEGHDRFILSTGMATATDIENVIRFLYSKKKSKIILLHCISEYPSPYDEINLKAINTLSMQFNLPVGLSDHSIGKHIPVAAIALGAVMIEKHITFNNLEMGPDHKASLELDEFKKMVMEIREVESALGDGLIGISKSESKNRDLVRKSIVAKTKISIGDFFTPHNITTKRPGTGISPIYWFNVINKKSKNDYEKDEILSIEEDWNTFNK